MLAALSTAVIRMTTTAKRYRWSPRALPLIVDVTMAGMRPSVQMMSSLWTCKIAEQRFRRCGQHKDDRKDKQALRRIVQELQPVQPLFREEQQGDLAAELPDSEKHSHAADALAQKAEQRAVDRTEGIACRQFEGLARNDHKDDLQRLQQNVDQRPVRLAGGKPGSGVGRIGPHAL